MSRFVQHNQLALLGVWQQTGLLAGWLALASPVGMVEPSKPNSAYSRSLWERSIGSELLEIDGDVISVLVLFEAGCLLGVASIGKNLSRIRRSLNLCRELAVWNVHQVFFDRFLVATPLAGVQGRKFKGNQLVQIRRHDLWRREDVLSNLNPVSPDLGFKDAVPSLQDRVDDLFLLQRIR